MPAMDSEPTPPLDREEARALLAAYSLRRDPQAARELASACMARLLDSLVATDRDLILDSAGHERHGLDAIHRLGYARAYQDRLHRYSIPNPMCAERMVQACRRAGDGPSGRLRALKEIAEQLGRMDGNARLAESKRLEPFEVYELAWHDGPGLATELRVLETGKDAGTVSPTEPAPEPALVTTTEGETDHRVPPPGPDHVLAPSDDLGRYLTDAEAGSTVRLGAGEHRLRTAFFIEHDLTLEGEEGARVVADFPGQMIVVERGARLEASGLELEHQGSSDADILHVEGEVALQRCSLRGARGRDVDARRHALLKGVGCYLTMDALALFEACEFADNSAAAVLADRESAVELSDCTVLGGAQAIVVRDQAKAEVRGGEVRGQAISGVRADGASRLSLAGVTVFGRHEEAGMVVDDDAEAVFEDCRVVSPHAQVAAAHPERVTQVGCELRAPTPFE